MFTRAYLLSIPSKKPILERLNDNAVYCDNGCIEFAGVKDRCGYGQLSVGKHRLGTHKLMYVLTVGDVPDGMELLHSCDNPACMNVEHLSINTHKANMIDCIEKGRHTFQKANQLPAEGNVIALFSIRKMALCSGQRHYIGKPCKKHGIGFRITRNGECIYCYKISNTRKRSRENKISPANQNGGDRG